MRSTAADTSDKVIGPIVRLSSFHNETELVLIESTSDTGVILTMTEMIKESSDMVINPFSTGIDGDIIKDIVGDIVDILEVVMRMARCCK
jgi:hypothetical protein